MVSLQTADLLGRQAEKTEHAFRSHEMREVVPRRFLEQGVVQQLPHLAQALPHLGEFHDPVGTQRVVIQDHRDHGRTVVRRHGIHRAHDVVGLRLHGVTRRTVTRDCEQGADAIAVEAEVLGAGVGDDHLGHAPGKLANDKRIGVQVGRKTLVGDIDERQQPPLDQNVGNGSPLRLFRIDPGRVVTAGMEQHDVTLGDATQRLQHPVEVQCFLFRVIVRVRLQVEAGAAEQGDVIRPRRIAGPDRRIGPGSQDDACGDPQRTRASRRLQHRNTIVRDRAREGQVPHRLVEVRRPRRTDVGLRHLRIDEALLGPLDDVQHRRLSRRVPVDADP